MWIRGAKRAEALAINQPLAYYRFFEANDSSKLMKTGDNLRDHLLLCDILSNSFDDFDKERFSKRVKSLASNQARYFLHKKDKSATKNNARLWWELLSFKEKLLQPLSIVLKQDYKKLKLILNVVI